MLGSGNSGTSIANDKSPNANKNIDEIPQSSNELDDDIPF